MHRQLPAYGLCEPLMRKAFNATNTPGTRHAPLGGFLHRDGIWSAWTKGLFIAVRGLQYNQEDTNGGIGLKQHDLVGVWYSPYTAMAARACLKGSHHELQGPGRDSEYQ